MPALPLPRFYQITPEPSDPPDCSSFLRQLDATLSCGIALVQLRVQRLDRPDHLRLARHALELCRAHAARLVFNGPVDMALESGCDGLHLNSRTLLSLQQRPVPQTMLLSAACHDARQLAQARRIGVDFVTLSPVLPTRTHPEASPLGWQQFAALAGASALPVFALGAMDLTMMKKARACGAWGIAAISASWQGIGQGPSA